MVSCGDDLRILNKSILAVLSCFYHICMALCSDTKSDGKYEHTDSLQ